MPADSATVEGLLESARRHFATGRTATTNDPEGSFSLAYDAARKAASAVLAHQGLRGTTAGGHIVIVEAMNAQFPGVVGDCAPSSAPAEPMAIGTRRTTRGTTVGTPR